MGGLGAEHVDEVLLFRAEVVQPAVLGGHLGFEPSDVQLALAEDVAGAGEVEECACGGLRLQRAQRDEEMRRGGIGRAGSCADLGGNLRAAHQRLEADALDMVLEEQGDVRKQLAQLRRELLEFEFMNVVGVGTREAARFRVVFLVWRGHDEPPGGSQHAAGFIEKSLPFRQVLDHFERDHEIHRGVRERQRRAGRRQEAEVRREVVLAGVPYGVGGGVHTKNGARGGGQRGRAIPGAATCIDHAPACGEAGGESVAGQVLVPKVGVDLPGDHALAREFNQR